MDFMEDRDLRGWRRWRRYVITAAAAVLLAAAGLAGGGNALVGEGTAWGAASAPMLGPGADADAGNLKITYGFDGTARRGRYLSVRAETALGASALGSGDGKAEMLFLVRESGGEACRYEYPMTLTESGGELTAYIPLGVRSSEMLAVLRDDRGNIAAQKKIVFPPEGDKPASYIGILSNRSGDLSWLDGISVEDNAFTTRTVSLDGSIPDNALAYDQLDMIVISDYDTGSLTDAQAGAVREYAENGGILLFGGGSDYLKSFGPFAQELLEKPYREAGQTLVNLGPEYAVQNPEDAMLELSAADISLKNGNTLIDGEQFPLAAAASWHKGKAAVTAFSLCDISVFCEAHPDFASRLVSSVYGRQKAEDIRSGGGGISGSYDSVADLVGAGDMSRLPEPWLYLAVLAAYLLLAGPLAYLSLRRLARSRYYLAAVSLLSFLFLGVIYVLGVRTRFRGQFYTSAAYVDLADGEAREETYLNLRSPFSRASLARLSGGYEICPVTDPSAGDDGAPVSGPEDYQIAISESGDQPEIRIRGTAPFTSNYFRLTRNLPDADIGTLEGNVSLFENSLSGTLTSRFSEPLENAVLFLYGKMVILGRIEPGEKLDLAGFRILSIPPGNASAAAEAAAGAYGMPDGKAKIQAQERLRMFRFLLQQEPPEADGSVRFAAFFPGEQNTVFLREDSRNANPDGSPVVSNGMTMVTTRMDADQTRDGEIYRCALATEPRVLAGNYDFPTNTMGSGNGSQLTLEYFLGSSLDISRVDFETPAELFSDGSIDVGTDPFSGNLYFYNYDTGTEDLMHRQDAYSAEELAPYLSPSNTLTVRYAAGNAGDGRGISLPVPYAVGTKEVEQGK